MGAGTVLAKNTPRYVEQQLEKQQRAKSIKAVVLRVNSPGIGGCLPTDSKLCGEFPSIGRIDGICPHPGLLFSAPARE